MPVAPMMATRVVMLPIYQARGTGAARDRTLGTMPEFTPVSVTDAGALTLLTQYFSDRESSFPSAEGTYRTTFPSPEQFLPPHGVFLLVSADPAGADSAGGDPAGGDPAGADSASVDSASGDPAGADPAGATTVDEIAYVGCGGIRRVADSPAGAVRYEVKHLFLQPHTRGRRWGRALLAELELRARELGADELVLDTNASLEAAGALYRKAGYVDIPPYNDNPNATNWYLKRLA